jgi:hypothetical protein
MKKLKHDLMEIADAMESSFDGEHRYFLDIQSAKVHLVMNEHLSALEDGDETRLEDIPEWEEDFLNVAREIFSDTTKRYLEIPTLESRDAFRQMEDFVERVEDERLREKLEIAINGRGAFRRFKDVLAVHPKDRDRWFEYKNEQMKNEVVRWLEAEEIEVQTT